MAIRVGALLVAAAGVLLVCLLAAENDVAAPADPGASQERPASGMTREPASSEHRVETRPFAQAPPAPPPTNEDGLPVRVVERGTENPVAGAVVLAVDPTSLAENRDAVRLALSVGDSEGLAQLASSSVRTGESGQTRVPRTSDALWVLATTSHRFAYLECAPRGLKELRLEVVPKVHVRVQVVDEEGKAAIGIPVGLRGHGPVPGGDRATPTRGPDGLAELQLDYGFLTEDRGVHTYRVALLLALAKRVEGAIDLDTPPQGIVRLVKPSTGALTVKAYDRAGRPPPGRHRATLALAGLPGSSYVRSPTVAEAPLENGRARFAHVGLGLELEARVAISHQVGDLVTRGMGPVRAGEEVVLELRPPANAAVVSVRLVDETGVPFSSQLFAVDLTLGPTTTGSEATTDRGGILEIEIGPGGPTPEGEIRVTEQVGPQERGSQREASLPLPGGLPAGVTSLGDLVLDRGPLLVSGIVVDEDGRPVPGTVLRLERPTHSSGVAWIPTRAWTVSRTDGAFEIHSHKPLHGDDFRIRAGRGQGHFQKAPAACTRGSAGIRVVVHRAGSVEGSFKLPPGIARLQVELVASEPTDFSDIGFPRWTRRGSFIFESVPPDRYALIANLHMGEGEELARIEDILVSAGEVTRDPRLEGIDLTSLINSLTVTVLDPQRRPFRGAIVWRYSGKRGSGVATNTEGQVELQVPSRARLDLEIEAEGHARQRLEAVTSDRTVVLTRMPELAIQATGPTDWQTEAVETLVFLNPLRSGVNPSHPKASLDARGQGRLEADPGRYTVSLSVRLRRRPTSKEWITLDPPLTLTIGDAAAPTTLRIALPPDRFEAAVQSLLR